jgi:hypothetical protein
MRNMDWIFWARRRKETENLPNHRIPHPQKEKNSPQRAVENTKNEVLKNLNALC